MSIITYDNTGLLATKRKFNANGLVETVETQDIEKIIENNKRLQNDRDFNNGMSESGDMKHVATVPLVIWKDWWNEEVRRRGGKIFPLYGREMGEIARKKLNDPDNKFLRTGQGEIGKAK